MVNIEQEQMVLASYSVCVICLEPELPQLNPLTRDHLFPKGVCDQHKRALEVVRNNPMNMIKVHWDEHKKIDVRKIEAYRSGSLIGLINFLAEVYPRSKDTLVLERQYLQWRDLFTSVNQNLQRVNGHTPPNLVEEYRKAIDLTGNYLYRWERGDFLNYIQEIDL